jgi:hypothetical protein
MKKLLTSLAIATLAIPAISNAQPCTSAIANGTSSNGLTNLTNYTKSIAVDKDLNTIVFIHRNDVTFGGTSSDLKYAISSDAGLTWGQGLGILNPTSNPLARYPQVAIYNPPGNTLPNNAYLSYMAATIDAGGAGWVGNVEGVRQLYGAGNTENYNQPSGTQTLIPGSMVKGAPGVFWSIDAVFDGTNINGLQVYRGVWNNSINDVQWGTNTVITPSFNTSYDGTAKIGDYHIAFDPSGQKGWISILTHLNGGPANYAYYPVFYSTVDGGISWNGPFTADISNASQFPCIAGNLYAGGGTVASTAFESDLTVDANGYPHLLTTILNGDNAYSVYFTGGIWHEMYDVTINPISLGFAAYDIAPLNSTRATGLYGSGTGTTYNWDFRPMISRTADGSKIFYNWIDSDPLIVGIGNPNDVPNLYSKALDVASMTWTNIKNFTACNPSLDGMIYFPKMAAEVLQPSSGIYKMAAVYTINTNNDFEMPVDLNFIDNLTWNNSDFIMASSTASTTVTATASSTSICNGSPVTLTGVGNATTYIWTSNLTANIVNGVAFTPIGSDTYTVTASNVYGCIATDAVTVNTLAAPTVSLYAGSVVACAGFTQTLFATGTATSFSWSPGALTGASISVSPTATTTFTVTGSDGSACTSTDTLTIIVNPLPLVTANTSASAICAGSSVTLTGSGTATSYFWTGGAFDGVSFSPSATTTYTVTGTNTATSCSNTATVTVTVNQLPSVMATTTDSTFCLNDAAVTFLALPSGGIWSGAGVGTGNFTPNVAGAGVHPAVYSYTDGNGCSNSATINMTVYALPAVTANATSTSICSGNPVTLTGGGASSYSWSGSVNNGISFIPVSTITYTVTGTDINGCVNTASTTVTVNPAPSVIAQSGNQTVGVGATVQFYVTSSQPGATFQWQTNIGLGWQNLSSFGQYSGTNNDTLTVSSVTISNNNQPFQCIITLGSCADTSALSILTVSGTVAINEINTPQLSVYPNPANSNITINVNPSLVGSIYYITDLLGKSVLSGKLQNETSEVNIDTLAKGMYLLNISGNSRNTLKIVKQ